MLVLLASFAALSTSMSIIDLRTEYRPNPIGIDRLKPRLSWRLTTTNPQRTGLDQTAYRILVASSPNLLAKDKADMWDSGRVPTNATEPAPNVAEYAGKPLARHQECWWKVQLWDDHSAAGSWSKPAYWSMGMQPSEWRAKWIGCADIFGHKPTSPNNITKENTVQDPWLRKEFDLATAPKRAVMYLASVGYQELYVNGKRAGDGILEPSVTDGGKRARYVTYDITKLLHPGKNVVGIWLGVSWSIFPHFPENNRPATPIALGQAELWFPDGRTETWLTDASWKTHPSPNKLLGVWDFMNYGGEEYDARQEIPDWSSAACDTSTWPQATEYQPKLEVSADNVEPNRCVKEIHPIGIQELPHGVYRVDMGVNFAGWIEAPVDGAPGNRIEFELSERAEAEMTHNLHSAYIIGKAGRGVFKNRFNYGVGRWITIKGLKHAPVLSDIRGWLVRTDYERAATFHSSDPLLNKIYDTALWTFENLSLGGYVVDCPQRERMGYGGDAHASTQLALDNYHMGAFYNKWALDWRDVQGEDGSLPYTAPTYWGGGGPAWMGFDIFMPWRVYKQYGDARILRDQYPSMKKWLAFMETHAKDDLLVRWGGDWDFLGDWLWPNAEGVNGDTPETLCFNNCYWVYALREAANVAAVLGEPEAPQYQARADQVATAINAKFFRPATHDYASGDQQYIAAALLADVPTPDERAAVWKRLEEEILVHRKGHIYAGIVGGALLTRVLLDSGRGDLMLPMVQQTDFPSWGKFIANGDTTFPEAWDGSLSQLHSSYLFVGAWFIEGLAGISQAPDKAGFRHLTLRPLVDKVDEVDATYNSTFGPIRVAWNHKGGKLNLTVTVPPCCTADLMLPNTPDRLLVAGSHEINIPAARFR